MTINQVVDFAKLAKPGDGICYRTGKQLSNQRNLDDYGDAVHAVRLLYNRGLVDLVQRRVGDTFDYIAKWRGEPRPPLPKYAKCGTPVHLFTGIPAAIERAFN